MGQRKHLLNMQYRMHPSISLFPNFRFYKKQILDGPNVEGINYNKNYEDLKFGAYAFLNVADGIEEVDEHGNSKRNLVEVVVVLHLVQRLFIRMFSSCFKVYLLKFLIARMMLLHFSFFFMP